MSKHDENMKKWEKRATELVRLYDSNEYSFADLGKKYDISAQRAQQIYARAKG